MKLNEIIEDLLRGNFRLPTDKELDELAYLLRSSIISLRLMPPETRRSIIERIFWLVKFLTHYIVLSATQEKELPPPLRPFFRYTLSSFPLPDTEGLKKWVCDPQNLMKNRLAEPSKARIYHIALRKELKVLNDWLDNKQFRKLFPLKRKELAKTLKPPAEKRFTEATVYASSINPNLYIVMNPNVLGRGKNLKEAIEDFARRWQLLLDADIPSRIPAKIYIEEMKLQPCGKVLVVEYETGEIRWKLFPTTSEVTSVDGREDDRTTSIPTGEQAAAGDSPLNSGINGREESGEGN
jgi:hypothetical protein